jgi:hypothetical protein
MYGNSFPITKTIQLNAFEKGKLLGYLPPTFEDGRAQVINNYVGAIGLVR